MIIYMIYRWGERERERERETERGRQREREKREREERERERERGVRLTVGGRRERPQDAFRHLGRRGSAPRAQSRPLNMISSA